MAAVLAGTVATAGGFVTSVSKPTGGTTGDYYVVLVGGQDQGGTPPTFGVTGFTAIGSNQGGSGFPGSYWYIQAFQVPFATAPATFNVTGLGGLWSYLFAFIVRGASGTVDVGVMTQASGSPLSVTLPSVTVGGTGGGLAVIMEMDYDGGPGAPALPTNGPWAQVMGPSNAAAHYSRAAASGALGTVTVYPYSTQRMATHLWAWQSASSTSPQTVTAQIGPLTLTGVAGTKISGGASFTAQIATSTLSGVAGALVPGGVTTAAQVATLTLTGLAGAGAGGPTIKTAQVAELYFTGIPGSGTIVGGGGAPTVLTVGFVSGTTAALSWTGPTGGGLVDIYNIETSPDNSVWTFNSTSVGSATNGVAIGLTTFTTYYFRVQAVFSASGPGPWSAAVLATTTDYILPGAPLSLTVGTVTNSTVALSWSPPAAGPLPVLGYWATYNGGSGPTQFLFGDLVLTVTAAGLASGTVYTFKVWAQNADGYSLPATVVRTTTGVLTGTAQVGALTLTAVAGTRVVGAATKTAPVGALTLTALAGVLVPGGAPQTTASQVAVLTLTAQPGMALTGQVVSVQVAPLPLSGVQGALTGGPVTKTAQLAALTITGIAGTRSVGPPPNQATTAQLAALTLTARPGALSLIGGATQTFTAQIAPLPLSGVQGAVIGGPVSKTAQIAALTLTGVPGVRTVLFTVTAQVATLTLTGRGGTLAFGGATQDAQIALLVFTALPGRLGVPFALSAHSDGTGLKDQRVEARVNNCDGQWGLFVRAPAVMSLAVERPGYYVLNTVEGVRWYRAGVLVEVATLPAFSTAGGTIELECIDDLCTLRVLGLAVATHDFSADPILDDDDHQGFASYGGSSFAITDAEGGGILVGAPDVVEDEDRAPLFPPSPPEERRPLATSASSGRRPL